MKKTKQIMRKCLSIFLSVLMLMIYAPMQVFAQKAPSWEDGDIFIIRYLEKDTALHKFYPNGHSFICEEGDILVMYFSSKEEIQIVKEIPPFLNKYEINGEVYYYISNELAREKKFKRITKGIYPQTMYGVANTEEEILKAIKRDQYYESTKWDIETITREINKQDKNLYRSLEELMFAKVEKRLLSLRGIYQTGKIIDLKKALNILSDDMEFMHKDVLFKEINEDINLTASKVNNVFWHNNGKIAKGYISMEIDQILNIYEQAKESALIVAKNSKSSELERLADAYLPLEMRTLNPESILKKFSITDDPIVTELRALQKELLETPNTKRIEKIAKIVSEKLDIVNNIVDEVFQNSLNIDKSLIRFVTETEKKEFLTSLVGELEKKMSPEDFDRLMKGIALGADDNVPTMIAKLQHVMENMGQMAASKASTKPNTIYNVIKTLKGLKTEKAQAEFIAEVQSKLTEDQKGLIREIYGEGDDFVKKLLGENAAKTAGKAKVASKGAAKVVTRVVDGPLMAVIGVITMATIVSIDAKAGNSFEQKINPVEFGLRIKNGTAGNLDKYVYYTKSYSSEGIEEDLEAFGEYFLSLADGISNVNMEGLLNDEMLEIKGWNPSGAKVNKTLDKMFEKYGNKTADKAFKKAGNVFNFQ